MLGPGKYDDLLTGVRLAAAAEGAVLIIVNGSKGSSFSAQLTLQHLAQVTRVLRQMLAQLEQGVQKDLNEAITRQSGQN